MMKSRKKEFKRKYFGSLTHQLILISICLVTGTLLLCWFINTVFLEPYYVINKQNTLLSGFETIDEASEAGTLDDSSFDVTFDNLCANGNITVMIISSDRTIVRSSVNDTQKMMLEFMNIIFGEKQNEVTVMMQSDNYIIQKQTDTRLDSEFLVLYGTLSNGNLILMRTALESIRESVNLSNTFLAWVGVVAAIISAVVIVFVSRGITTPLLRLTDISKRMTELDFEECDYEKIIETLKRENVRGIAGSFINDPETDIMEMKAQLSAGGIKMDNFEPALKWADLKKNSDGMVPVIVQDYRTDEVLMLAYMNEEAFETTINIGKMTYYSRSRQELWIKGMTSGHIQYVKSLTADCDYDTILAKVSQIGAACHTGNVSCFFNEIVKKEYMEKNPLKVLEDVYAIILDRKANPKEGSYTNYLFDKGIDKILKKIGEEASEIIIAAKNPDPEDIKYEISDFMYHMMVLMAEKGVTWEEITQELSQR